MPLALEQIAQHAGNFACLRPAPGVQAGFGTALQALRDVEIGFAVSDEIKDRHDRFMFPFVSAQAGTQRINNGFPLSRE
jgi:hypothetical protein